MPVTVDFPLVPPTATLLWDGAGEHADTETRYGGRAEGLTGAEEHQEREGWRETGQQRGTDEDTEADD